MLAAASFAFAVSGSPFLKHPDVHGDRVVFSCEGDVWLGDLKTGTAVRMTRDEGLEDAPCFSPDGTMIAFHGEYDGIRGAYVMPVGGGAPKRVSYATDFRSVTGWTPDGKAVLFRKAGVPTNYEYWTAPIGAGAFRKLPLEFSSHVWFGPTESDFVFTRFNRWYAAWFRYIGGMQNQVWRYDGKAFRQLTDLPGTNEFPVWCGDQAVFVNEQDSKFTLMAVPVAGGRSRALAPASDMEIRELSTDGRRVVFERGRGLAMLDLQTGQPTDLAFRLDSDLAHTRPYQVDAQDTATAASLTPGAKRVLVETRGQIVSLPVGEGEARLWKAQPGARLQLPTMSPDAAQVAFVSDESGEQQVHLAAADGSGGKRLTNLKPCQIKSVQWSPDGKHLLVYTSEMKFRLADATTGQDKEVAHFSGSWFAPPVSFSPDSKWIAYVRNVLHTQVNQIEVYEVATGKTTVVSDGTADDSAVAFSTDGKFLAFVSRRSLGVSNDPVLNQLNLGSTTIPCVLPLTADTESPFTLKDPAEEAAKPADKPAEPAKPDETKKDEGTKIEFDGLYQRRVEVPMPAGAYSQIAMVKGRILVAGGGQIQFYDYQAKRAGVLTQGGAFQLNKDGSKALVGLRVIDTAGENVALTTGALSFGGLKLRIEPLPEWRQMFWDAWRLLRDYFYVANMHGLDWKAVGAKYAALLPSVRSREELDDLIRWMQSELGSSHQYLDVGDTRDIKPRIVPAYLGLDYEASPAGLRIAKIVRGDGFRTGERSPLADPALKVKEGMYVLRVAGQPVESELDVNDLLLGRAGQVVGVTVNDKPGAEGARTVYVRPVANERRMRYLAWVEANRRYVDKASGGRIGYLHLAAMGNEDMSDFVKQYFPQQGKDAMLVDVRFNNGGYIQTLVNNVLDVHISGYFNMRESREPWSRQWDGFVGPQACLINEFSISCGEEFPHRFKDLGIGPLIGRRTMGGEVGSSPGWPLVDGGVVSVPNYGMFTTKDGWVIEGAGVSPDIDVTSDPNAFVAGKDAQLDAGVKSLMEALKKHPVVRPQPPADRVRTKR